MSFVLLWLRHEGRRRWRALLALGLLLAVVTAAVLTAVAGARRGASAVGRLLAVTQPATAEVVPNHAGFNWRRVRTLPEVAALTTFPAYTSLPIDQVPGDAPLTPFIPADRAGMRTIEAPVVLAGRLAGPARADEAVVTPAFTSSTGLGIGDTVTAHLTTPAQADASVVTGLGGRPAGPVVRLRIVGVVRSLWYGDDVRGTGSLIPSPGLLARYPDNFLGESGLVPRSAIVRLRGGEASLPRFRADVARVGGRPDVQVLDRGEVARHYRSVTGFESSCLLALGLAAFLAGLVLAGQAITRHVSASGGDLRALGAVGLTRPQAAAAAAAGPVLAAAVGAAAGAGLAVAVSRWLPFGAAATKEPNPGVSADWLVLGAGWALTVALVAAAAAVTAWLAVARRGSERAVRGSAVVHAVARSGLPAPAVIGARLALEPGSGRSAVPVRSALTGAVTGVLGVIAAFTFAAGVADAAAHPARFGQTYQLEVALGGDGHDFRPAGPVLRALAADPDIAGLTDLRVGAGSSGAASVTAYSYHPVGAPAPLVLAAGRLPATGRDLVLAPETARRLGARVGSLVPLTGDRGTRRMQVTGIGFGVESSTTPYDTGGWITPGAYDALFSGFKEHGALLALRAGADPGTVIARLQRPAAGPGGARLLIFPPFVPKQRTEVRDIQVLPVALGGFLSLLAIGAVGHALMTAMRRRAHDIALLRALGMTPAQARWVAIAQAAVFGSAGLLAGVPLGLAAGRALWRVAAGLIPLYYQPPTAPWALLLIGPAVLACALLLALAPGIRAARLPVGPLLRPE
jgi:hypothetical protein